MQENIERFGLINKILSEPWFAAESPCKGRKKERTKLIENCPFLLEPFASWADQPNLKILKKSLGGSSDLVIFSPPALRPGIIQSLRVTYLKCI
mmetsp:Transcript_2455/g.3412  ORF Transcript_2455/g.3412 Transcript_2455/m.3412 type:complete len:94 (+) Transcript_2455:20-301(+)